MILLTWNIRQGGGSRVPSICHHIEDVGPDLLAFTEFQARNEASLRAHLGRLGYPFIVTSKPIANHNGILVACRWPLERAPEDYTLGADQERWLALRFNELDLDILVVHIPGAPDNKFENGYDVSGVKPQGVVLGMHHQLRGQPQRSSGNHPGGLQHRVSD